MVLRLTSLKWIIEKDCSTPCKGSPNDFFDEFSLTGAWPSLLVLPKIAEIPQVEFPVLPETEGCNHIDVNDKSSYTLIRKM